ncbi:transposase family protein [Streptomyces mirabilis]|uniref:transposase family protein n=1 Tax=Streptomyces mirabilis TaxID=68239 RepID=UPI003799B7AB
MPDPRDPRGVRHALVVVLALTACAVLAGARSLLAVGEWIADAPPPVLQAIGASSDPLFAKREMSPSTNQCVPFQVLTTSRRAVWHPRPVRNPWERSEN